MELIHDIVKQLVVIPLTINAIDELPNTSIITAISSEDMEYVHSI